MEWYEQTEIINDVWMICWWCVCGCARARIETKQQNIILNKLDLFKETEKRKKWWRKFYKFYYYWYAACTCLTSDFYRQFIVLWLSQSILMYRKFIAQENIPFVINRNTKDFFYFDSGTIPQPLPTTTTTTTQTPNIPTFKNEFCYFISNEKQN